MTDPRTETLAKNLVNYSCSVKPGEKILIETRGYEVPLTKALVKEVYKAGGVPFVTVKNDEIMRALLIGCNEEQIRLMARFELDRMKEMDAYIGVRYADNASELSDVPEDKMKLYSTLFNKPVHSEQRVEQRNGSSCVIRTAQWRRWLKYHGSLRGFFFKVCCLDYAKMSKAMDGLVELMNRTDRVRIVGRGTDLTFSIRGIPAIKCDGHRNIPDGEVYTAPVRDSVNGTLTYNTPSKYQGFTYENVTFEFKDGKIINAKANDTDRINKVLDTDEGARYVGEFSLGINPYIEKPMKDTLFDEKIRALPFHSRNCYDICNGNKSAVHWDLVCIQRPEYGGGEIWFDDVLIRKDGVFVLKELEPLNPENLV